MRPKKPITQFSAWEYLGTDILDEIEKGHSSKPIQSTQIAAVMTAAINPEAFAAAESFPEGHALIREFLSFYALSPDLVLQLMQRIRKKWNSKTGNDIAQRFILTRIRLREPELTMQDEKLVGKSGVLMSAPEATAGEITLAIKKTGGPTLTKETVTKARNRIRPPRQNLQITFELNDALKALRSRGFDVGLGR